LTVSSVSFTVTAWYLDAEFALMIHYKYRMLLCGQYD
jgi:hypothetical protein